MWNPGDRRYRRLLEIDNEVEAQLLSAYLTEQKVPHIIQSYHDSAYGPLFQSQMVAWGYLEAPKEYEPLIRQVHADITGEGNDTGIGDEHLGGT